MKESKAQLVCRKNLVAHPAYWKIPSICFDMCKKRNVMECTIYKSYQNEQTRIRLQKAGANETDK